MGNNKKTEEQLAILARKGDESAMEAVFRSWRKSIRANASLYFLAGGDKDDLIQEGMIGLFRAIMDYDREAGASFRTFAELCISRQMMTAVRSATRQKHRPLNESVSFSDVAEEKQDEKDGRLSYEDIIATKEPSPEQELIDREQLRSLEDDLAKLFSPFEMQVWNNFRKGLTYTEIAKKLDKTPKSIDNAIQRMKKKVENHIS